VEAVHARVLAHLRPGSIDAQPHTTGLTGWIYRTVRRITRLSGYGTAWMLGAVGQVTRPTPRPDTEPRHRLLSVLNGVLGDHLAASGSPLARPFSLHTPDGRQMDVDARSATTTNTLVVFVHGLCLSDRAWIPTTADRSGHVEALAAAVNGTPALARYNTGRSIEANGQALSEHLQRWTAGTSGPSRIILVTHSMGGLVARRAVHYARRAGACWPDRVTETVYLGTPHRGAPLERAGAWVENQLCQTSYTAPFAALADLRSQGIQELRHGIAAPSDAPSASVFSRKDTIPTSGRTLYVAGTLISDQPARNAIGDGLVPVSSALDTSASSRPANRRVFEGTGHLDLLHDPAVTEYLRDWLSAAERG
jgi:pimeloyl-ACP methyl ester carboxylesterase